MKIKKVLITLGVLLFMVIAFFAADFLYRLSMVGSYPYSEDYIVNLPESDIIQKTVELKEKDLSLQVPPAGYPFGALTDEKRDYWYYAYFLLQDRKTVVLCYVRAIDENTTRIGLVFAGTGPEFLNSKQINARKYFMLQDLSEKENRELKKEFEKQILDRLGIPWEKESWW
jgi:hypothetical protein